MELNTRIFMGLMFIIGLILSSHALKISDTVLDCNKKAQHAVRGLLILGVILMSVSITYMACGCKLLIDKSFTELIFVFLMFLIGFMTIILSSIIHSNCSSARKSTPVLLVLSVILTLISGGYLIHRKAHSEKK